MARADAAYAIEALREITWLEQTPEFRARIPAVREVLAGRSAAPLMEQAVAARPDDPGLRHKMPTTGPGPLAPSERSDISQLLRFPTAERLHRVDPDLYSAIEAIADKHLGFREPRKGFSDSTMEIENRELRERIQSTANQTRTISDKA